MTPFSFARIAATDKRTGPPLAVVVGGKVAPLGELWRDGAAPSTLAELLGDWDRHLDLVADAVERADLTAEHWHPARQVGFLPPVDRDATLYCAGANYYDHIEEMGAEPPNKATTPPFHFVLPASALQSHLGDVIRPGGVEQLDWEVELAAVIGRRADSVPPERALDHVAGYTVANDVSCRDADRLRHPIFGMNFLWLKGQRTMQPLGPTLVPARFVPDPGALGLRLSVNGTVRQDSTTAKMIFTTEEQIAHLSATTSLLPGDVLLTGTPAGTAAAHGTYLRDGDRMVAEIDGVGRLENRVIGHES